MTTIVTCLLATFRWDACCCCCCCYCFTPSPLECAMDPLSNPLEFLEQLPDEATQVQCERENQLRLHSFFTEYTEEQHTLSASAPGNAAESQCCPEWSPCPCLGDWVPKCFYDSGAHGSANSSYTLCRHSLWDCPEKSQYLWFMLLPWAFWFHDICAHQCWAAGCPSSQPNNTCNSHGRASTCNASRYGTSWLHHGYCDVAWICACATEIFEQYYGVSEYCQAAAAQHLAGFGQEVKRRTYCKWKVAHAAPGHIHIGSISYWCSDCRQRLDLTVSFVCIITQYLNNNCIFFIYGFHGWKAFYF